MIRRRAALLALLCLSVLAGPAAAAPGDDVRLVPVGQFDSPTDVTAPPDDRRRVFVVERAGLVRVVRDGVPSPEPFLDIRDLVLSGGERGLLSLAFAPDYRSADASAGRFYVLYTDREGDGDVRVDEFRREGNNPNVADRASRRTLLVQEHSQFGNHNGGQVHFGPDGFLYVSIGDGGGQGDPFGRAQSLDTLLGKLLRIDPTPGAAAPYQVPADNPFVNRAGARPEIWAYGLRNPFRFSFDRAGGDLTIADVGASAVEEVNYLPGDQGRGANLGWKCFEGRRRAAECDAPGHVPPVLERLHADGDCSITGGYVVRDSSLGSLFGRYLHGDFCTGQIRSAALAQPETRDDPPTGLTVPSLSSFGEDACGRIYVASIDGPVSRLDGPNPAPCSSAPPRLDVQARRTQRLGRRRALKITARCGEACTVRVFARVAARNSTRVYRSRTLTRELAAGVRTTLSVRFSRPALDAILRFAARGRRPIASGTVNARNARGNKANAGFSIRIRR